MLLASFPFLPENILEALCEGLVVWGLNSVCYLMRNIKPYMPLNTLKVIYQSLFHSVMSYGLIFWGNSSYADTVFKLQKRVVRIMLGCGNRESCRDLLKVLSILSLKSQYIYRP